MSLKSKLRSQWRKTTGNPEGNAMGTPGDMLYDEGLDILWVKVFGLNNRIGWKSVPISDTAGPEDVFAIGRVVSGFPSTNILVLSFDFDDFGGDGISLVTTAAGGTEIRITRAGIYQCQFTTINGLATLVWGISKNATGALLTGGPGTDPDIVIPAYERAIGNLGATGPLTMDATVHVNEAEAQNVAVIRAQGSDGAGGSPVGFVGASTYFQVRQIA